MGACRRLFPFLHGVSAQLPVCKYGGSLFWGRGRVRELPPAGQGISADGRGCAGEGGGHEGERGDGQSCRQFVVWADTRFPGGTVPAVVLPLSEGRQKVVGGGNWVRASGGDGFSAAGFSPLLFSPGLAGLGLPVFGITALTVE